MKKISKIISATALLLGLVVGSFSIWSCQESPTAPIGSSWTTQTLDTLDELNSITWTGKQFVTVGSNSGNGIILTSPDGLTWTLNTEVLINKGLNSVTWNDSQIIAVGSGVIVTSSDGVTWKVINVSNYLYGITWAGNKFVAVGSGPVAMISPDGVTWTTEHPTEANLSSVTWTGKELVAVGGNFIQSSPDGVNWTIQDTIGNEYGLNSAIGFNTVIWTGKQLVAVGGNDGDPPQTPSILTSPDGVTWTTRTIGTSGWINSVAWTGNILVASQIGSNPQTTNILTSSDGVTWTVISSKNTFSSATWTGTKLVGVIGNTILTSP